MVSEETEHICAATTGCHRRASVGLICRGHLERLSAMLRDIEAQARLLDPVPSMAQRTGSGSSSLASERASARLAALAYLDPRTKRWEPALVAGYIPPAPKSFGPWCLFCDHDTCTAWRAGRRRDLHNDEHDAGSASLASVLGELHGWARIVREDRALTAPDQVTIATERDLLTRQLDWIAGQGWVDEMHGDLAKLLGQLQAVNGTAPDKPAAVCYLPDDNGQECGGHIWRSEQVHMAWAPLPDRCVRTPVEVADGPAYCDRCGNKWDGADLARLNLILEAQHAEAARPRTEDGRRMLTADELVAQGFVSSISNVRVTAHRKGKSAVGGHYDPQWFGKVSA